MTTQFAYMNAINELLESAYETNKDIIPVIAGKVADTVMADKLIHTIGSGHSYVPALEVFGRAGGLANVNCMMDPDVLESTGAMRGSAVERLHGLADIIYDTYHVEQGDMIFIISNSGRNALPVEMAMRCQNEGVYVAAMTSVTQSHAMTSRHESGKRLFELADAVLDNCAPKGDGCLDIDGIITGPVSNIVGLYLINTVMSEAIRIMKDRGFAPMVFQSQNVDGYDNDAIWDKFRGRIKHF